jgi:predicted RND superfamily exporter protein
VRQPLTHRAFGPALVVALCIGAGLFALRLDADAGAGTLTDQGSSAARATNKFHEQFGEEPIRVLVRGRAADGNLPGILLTEDVDRIRGLEGCLSGNLPAGAQPPASACAKLAKSKPIRVVQGPGTFINESARQIASRFKAQRDRHIAQAERAARKLAAAQGLGAPEQERLAQRARQLVIAQFKREVLRLGLVYGFTGAPALNNPYFVLKLVFEPSLGFEVPKSRFSYLFPSKSTALIQARPRAGLSLSQRREMIALVRDAVASPAFALQHGDYLVSGEPLLEEGVAKKISGALGRALLLTILLVGAALAFLFHSRPRLVPLLGGLLAAALTFGVVSLFGGTLTIAQVAALPVLVGLAACFAILLQLRFTATPVIVVAALITTIGLLVIRLSPVPMVRGFGTDLAVGVVAGLVVMMTVGGVLRAMRIPDLPRTFGRRIARRAGRVAKRFAATARRAGPVAGRGVRRIARALVRTPRPAPPARVASVLGRLRQAVRPLAVAVAAGARNTPALAKRVSRRVVAAPVREPRRVLAIALVIAVAGWVLDSRTDVVSGLEQLGPKDAPEVKDARTFTNETRQAGEVSVVVRAKDLTSPQVISWMSAYQKKVLASHGYSARKPCRSAELCPSLSLTNLFAATPAQTPAQVPSLLRTLPRNFSQAVVSPDGHTGIVAFIVRAMPISKQRDLIEEMRDQLDPPRGVHAELAGPPTLAAEARSDLQSSRRQLALAGLLAVFAILLMSYGSFRTALGPLITVALATGWSGLVIYVVGTPLNALSGSLPAIVVAVTAGLGLVLSDRYRRDRAGLTESAALARAYDAVRSPLLACAAVTVAGFAALVPNDVRALRDFGLVGAIDLIVVLAATALVLPAALIWAEQAAPWPLPRSRAEAAGIARKVAVGARPSAATLGRLLRRLPVGSRRARRES